MKHIFLLTALFFTFVTLSSAQKNTTVAEIKTRIYCDHCKACSSCSSRLEEAVYALKGIKRVDIDDKSMMIRVVYDPKKTNTQNIEEAIAATGYDAGELKADPAAYSRLDDCCKKQ